MDCPKCKKTIPENSKFCPECGAEVEKSAAKSKKDQKTGCIGCLAIIVIAVFVMSLMFGSGEDSSELTTAELAALSLEDFGRVVVESELGKKAGEYERFIKSEISGNQLQITLVARDGFSNESTLNGIKNDAIKLFKATFESRQDIDRLVIRWHLPLIDQYGNKELGQVVAVALFRTTAEKIDWDNIVIRELEEWVDYIKIHPALTI